MFPLLRYFSVTSFAALGLVTWAIIVLNRNMAVDELAMMGETGNVAVTQVVANSIWPRFATYVTSVSGHDGDALRKRPETGAIREDLMALTHHLSVLKVKIYNLDGLTVFSSQESQIGEDKSGNPGFVSAAGLGEPASQLTRRGKFSAFSGEVYDRSIIETYVPIQSGDGSIEAVF